MTSIIDQADSLRDRASFFVTQRRKDLDLYRVLGDCMCLCAACSDADLEEFRRRVLARATGRRSYFEAGADAFLIVGRYVFEGQDKRRDATWRYTAVMREAAKRQISGSDLPDWLASNGGVNALFKSRPVAARTTTTKTLNLNQPISVPKDEAFTITLSRDARGFFDVVPT